MTRNKIVPPSNWKDVLERNARINVNTVAAHEKLEENLKKLGVEIKPSYNLEPPLGRNPARFHNRTRCAGAMQKPGPGR